MTTSDDHTVKLPEDQSPPPPKFRGNLRVPASELAEHPQWYEGCQVTPIDDENIFVVKFPPRVKPPGQRSTRSHQRRKPARDLTVWRSLPAASTELCSGHDPRGLCGQLATVTADGITFLCDHHRILDDQKHQWNGTLKQAGLSTKLDRVRPFRRT